MLKALSYLLLYSLLLVACNRSADYSASIHLADSLARRTDSICVYQANAGPHALLTRKDSILHHLSIIQSDFKGVMDEKTALYLSDYRRMANDIDQVCLIADTLDKEGLKIKSQLSALSLALKNKATHDALNNEIDSTYVRKALAEEVARQKAFEEKSKALNALSDSIRKKFDGYYPVIRQMTDSIQARKK